MSTKLVNMFHILCYAFINSVITVLTHLGSVQ